MAHPLDDEYERLAAGYNDAMGRLGDAFYLGYPMSQEEEDHLRTSIRQMRVRLDEISRIWDAEDRARRQAVQA